MNSGMRAGCGRGDAECRELMQNVFSGGKMRNRAMTRSGSVLISEVCCMETRQTSGLEKFVFSLF